MALKTYQMGGKVKLMENKAKLTQIEKYGSEEAYRAEMKRRRSLVKKPGFASMDPEKHKELSSLGGKHRWQNKDEQTQESSRPS